MIDDYFGANFMGGKTNVSWDYNGHGSGTSAVLGGVNNGDSSSQLGVSPKVHTCMLNTFWPLSGCWSVDGS